MILNFELLEFAPFVGKIIQSLYSCRVPYNKTASECYKFCKSLRLCFNCLKKFTLLIAYKSQSCCKKFNSKKLHTYRHSDHANKEALSVNRILKIKDGCESSKDVNDGDEHPKVLGTSIASESSSTLLSTVWLKVLENSEKLQQLICLLDSGRVSTFLTQSTLSELGRVLLLPENI